MSYTLRSQIAQQYSYHAKESGKLNMLEGIADELGLLDLEYYFQFGTSSYENGKSVEVPYITLEPRHVPGVGIFMERRMGLPELHIVDTTPTLADAAKALISKVGAFRKSFDDKNNIIRLTAVYKGVEIRLEDKPPDTCTVERVEEEVKVAEQVIPAHVEKLVRWVMTGDCDPLMEDAAPTPEPQETPA